MWHIGQLLLCAAAIYFSCEWFVNAVEWLGHRLAVGRMAVGTILAALGTALPESVVTLIAVTTGKTAASRDIGVGAAMGGPLALATIAYGVTGIVMILQRGRPPAGSSEGGAPSGSAAVAPSGPQVLADPAAMNRLAKDQLWFLPIFVVKVVLGLVAFAFKPALGVLFFAVYVIYFWRQLRSAEDGAIAHDELEPLKFQPRTASPATWAIAVQTLLTLVVIYIASELFVRQLEWTGPEIGLSGAVTALLLAPVATELPEVMNAIIWIRQGKTELALANISGAMMIQATVPSGLGLLFTSWHFDGALLWSGVVTMAAIAYLLTAMWTRRLTPARLSVAAGFYLIFIIGLVPILSG